MSISRLDFLGIVLMVAALTGCTSFKSADLSLIGQPQTYKQPDAKEPADPNIPPLQNVEVAPDSKPVHNLAGTTASSYTENPFKTTKAVNDFSLASSNEIENKTNNTENNTDKIDVVRLPKTEQASQRVVQATPESTLTPEEIQFDVLPTDAGLTKANTANKDNSQVKQVNYEEPRGKTPAQWKCANGADTGVTSNDTLTMTPGVLDIDKQRGIYQQSESNRDNQTEVAQSDKVSENDTAVKSEANQVADNNQAAEVNIELPELELTLDSPVSENQIAKSDSVQNDLNKTGKNTEIQQCSAVEPMGSIRIDTLKLVSDIRKLGQYTEIAAPYQVENGKTILAYMEIENPRSVGKMKTGFELEDSLGKIVQTQNSIITAPEGEKNFFQYVKYTVPKGFKPGKYTFRVWAQDSAESKKSTQSISVTVF